ncbi:MAG: PAS domain-containing protein [Candidatus Thiodiazotropha sp.]
MATGPDPTLNEIEKACLMLVEASPSAALCVVSSGDGQYRVLGSNAASRNLLKNLDSSSTTTTLEYHFVGPDVEALATNLDQCLKSGNGVTFTKQYTTNSGLRHFLTSMTPLRDPVTDSLCVYLTATDITEAKQAQTNLALLEFALNQVHESAMIIGEDARILYANSEASRALEYTQDELLTMSIPQVDPNWPAERWPEIWSSLTDLGSLHFESRHQTKDGRILSVEINASHLNYQGRDYAFALARDISERKRIEMELHKRSEEFRALVDHSPELLIRYDRQCRRIYANPAFIRQSGMSPEQLLGNTPTGQRVLLTEPDAYEAKIREAIETGETTELTFSWQDLNGNEFWTHARYVPERETDGHIASVLAICHDVTSLKTTERQLSTLINNIPDMVSRFDLEGRIIYYNPTVKDKFGFAGEDFIGKPLPGKDITGRPLTEQIREAASTGKPNRCEAVLEMPDGPHHFNVQHVPEKDRYGRVTSVLGIASDVTDLFEAQHALRESEARYRQIFDNTQESLFLLEAIEDQRFRILEVNPAFERSLGVSADTLIGNFLDQALPSAAADAIGNQLRRCLANNTLTEDEVTFDAGEGEKTFHTTLIPVNGKSPAIKRIVGLTRDITHIRKSEHAMKRLNRALKTLSSGNEALVRATNETELLDNMCSVVVEVGNYHAAWIGYSQSDGKLTPVTGAGDRAILKVMEQHRQQSSESSDPATRAVDTNSVQVIHDFTEIPECTPFGEMFAQRGVKACLALPLSDSDSAFGVLAIYSTDDSAFDEEEVKLLTEMAEDLSYGIHSLRARTEKESFLEKLQESMESTIRALASTVELRDPYTAGHQQRVAELAVAVCRHLGWPEEKAQATYLAGLVHDIGKIAIPAEILSKPGRLNDAEYTLVRTHADAGCEILKSVDFNWPIAQIVKQHHERLDGSGYPTGLKAEAILPEAKVLAVCDVVEAMTTHRPYRPGLGIEAALIEIEAGKDTFYDAEVVDACIQLIRDEGFQFS